MNLNPPKGTRDFLPEEMIARERVIKIIKDTFEIYGFLPMETPAFERWEVLTKKCGEEIKNQIYGFEDKAGRKLGLRFDLTVPLARVIASHPTVPKPFKRYCISRVWRYEEPQAGRFREFWQADIDVIGIESLQADVECVSCAAEALIKLGIDDFSVFVNSRKVLEGVAESVGIESESVKLSVFRAIDKLEKIGENGVRKELEEIGLSAKQINGIFELLRLKSIEEAKEKLKDIEVAAKGVEELEEIYRFANKANLIPILQQISRKISIELPKTKRVIDWKRTKAFFSSSVGPSAAIEINLQGRESEGIVKKEEYDEGRFLGCFDCCAGGFCGLFPAGQLPGETHLHRRRGN